MKLDTRRIVSAGLFVAVLAAGVLWWWLRDQRVRLERELVTAAEENQKIRALHAHRSAEAMTAPTDLMKKPTPTMPSWQEQVRLLSEALKNRRLASPVSRPPHPPSGPSGDLFKELMDDPKYARLAMKVWRAGWRAQWLRPFRWAGVPPDKQEKLYSLFLDQGQVRDDVGIVGKELGLGQEAIFQLQRQEAAAIEAETRALLGDDAYDRVMQARRADGANALISRVETRLSYSATALDSKQGEQLFALLVKAKVGFMVETDQLAPVFDQARGFLRPDQLAALQAVAEEFNLGKRVETGP